MKPHQERVVVEANELNIKLLALDKFIYGDIFKPLPVDEQMRLLWQPLRNPNE